MTDGPEHVVRQFIDRGMRAQAVADAVAVSALFSSAVHAVDNALAEKRSPNVRRELEHAKLELAALGRALTTHFERFAE